MARVSVPVVLALGANLGDRAATLAAAVAGLVAVDGLAVHAVSPVFASAAVGGPPQPDYLNAVVLARTTLAPDAVLAACQGVEAAAGRKRSVRWGPRTLDVDVIAYGTPGTPDEVLLCGPDLTLPHPRAYLRAFVLAPWAALDPRAVLRLPDGTLASVTALLAAADDVADVQQGAAL